MSASLERVTICSETAGRIVELGSSDIMVQKRDVPFAGKMTLPLENHRRSARTGHGNCQRLFRKAGQSHPNRAGPCDPPMHGAGLRGNPPRRRLSEFH
jgi:hypothetical protein